MAPVGELSEESVGSTVYQSVMEGGPDGLYKGEITTVDKSVTTVDGD